MLTHWGRVTHICPCELTNIGSDNGLSPGRRQAIIWTNAGILLIGPLATYFNESLIEIQTFSLKKIRLKMSSVKCLFRLGLNVLTEFRFAYKPNWSNLSPTNSATVFVIIAWGDCEVFDAWQNLWLHSIMFFGEWLTGLGLSMWSVDMTVRFVVCFKKKQICGLIAMNF